MRQMAAGASIKEQRVSVDNALSLQLWRATGLAPKALQCPRHVFSSEPESEPSTSAPPADQFVFRIPQPQAPSQCFYNGPVDTLPSYQQGGHHGGFNLSRRPSRAAMPAPPPPAPPQGVKQPRSKPLQVARPAPSSAAASPVGCDPSASVSDADDCDPLGVLLSQCSRRQRTGKTRRPVVSRQIHLHWLEPVEKVARKGSRPSSHPHRQTSQQHLLAGGAAGAEMPLAGHSSGGSGSVSSGFGTCALDAKGQPLSPSSPLSEWRV
ncbi:hypothetical protein TSOC_001348 [Tetrabaena socialis]|uniref:Uncharacterized protein n=1 Tax=Tetrabaena socialis TaxID=47790 RepID=A0A2J8AGX4_9CHLO|nr:hypothetical protein TSOC_001348 [Tetrabaena socialis]|eukprot:PNH11761.1 hypothetical protein TSOC_001348 [Tetrabaena socialis]